MQGGELSGARKAAATSLVFPQGGLMLASSRCDTSYSKKTAAYRARAREDWDAWATTEA